MLRVDIDADGTISSLKAYAKGLNQKCTKTTDTLVDDGYSLMHRRLENIIYDGDHDDAWVYDTKNGPEGTVYLEGRTAAFIEFGTGVYYPDDHPKAAEFGAVRGGYGKHQGLNPPWIYVGDPGSNGVVIHTRKRDGQPVVLTMGNPANRVVYGTARDLARIAPDKVKEVFSK